MKETFLGAAVMCVGAPVLALGFAAPAAWAAPGTGGGCSGTCSVGGAGTGGTNSVGKAQGFYEHEVRIPKPIAGTRTQAGTDSTGRVVTTTPSSGSGSFSGNLSTGKGHCTGDFC